MITICVHKLWLPPVTSFSVRDMYMLPLYLVTQIYQTHPFNQFCSIVLARIYCVSQNIKTLISKYMENSTSIYGQNQRETKFIEFNICWHNFNSEDNYSLNCTHFIPPFLGTINMSKTEKIWLEWRFNYWCIFNLKYLNIGFIIEKLKGVVYDFVYLVELNMFYFLTMLKPLIGKYTPV